MPVYGVARSGIFSFVPDLVGFGPLLLLRNRFCSESTPSLYGLSQSDLLLLALDLVHSGLSLLLQSLS